MENLIEILKKKIEKEDFFLSIKKVAEILSVSKTTILMKLRAREIKYIKAGKSSINTTNLQKFWIK